MFKTAAEDRTGPGVDSEPTLHRAVKVEQHARRLGMLQIGAIRVKLKASTIACRRRLQARVCRYAA